ncbi:Ger(x)C family spore germination protein [Paenibacillus solisilvae]|uniref:Ger(X)C family spore germination protein n=1 Tax=Paenibacillus solisilvae TaxID=2486751 RepID=A0ABW0W8G4_9BACL
MKRTASMMILFSLFVITGCWDRVELNDRAIMLGWGMDILEDGSYRGVAQFVVPSTAPKAEGGSSKDQPYFVKTGIGKNILDAAEDMQRSNSRREFAGHRRAIFLGKRLAKHGLREVIDEYSRNSDLRLRSDVFIIKNGEALDMLNRPYPLEVVPSVAAIKAHEIIGIRPETTLRDFLIAASGEESSPTLPLLELINNDHFGGWKLAGIAIFNEQLKMIGNLPDKEAKLRRWIIGGLKKKTLSVSMPEGKGNFVVDTVQLKSKIQPVINGKKVQINVMLSGKGVVRENNTNLDLSEPKNLRLLEETLNKEVEKSTLQMIKKVQKNLGTDIFKFGTTIHRQYPKEWKTLKKNWSEEFAKIDVSVKVKINVQRVGITGPPTWLPKKEIKKK